MRTNIIVATCGHDRAIGLNNDLPWKDVMPVPNPDMRRFTRLTKPNPVIMGRRTWESLPEDFCPLPGRENIVVSRSLDKRISGAWKVDSYDEALERAEELLQNQDAFVIGGARLYEEALRRAKTGDRLHVTQIDLNLPADTYFPAYDDGLWRLTEREIVSDFTPKLTFDTYEHV